MKTFLRRRGKVVLRPANPTMDEMVFEPDDVQVYGKVVTLVAPPLIPTNALSTSAHRTKSSRSTNSPAVCASSGSPGPKLQAGMPWLGEAGDVGPTELRAHAERSAADELGHERVA